MVPVVYGSPSYHLSTNHVIIDIFNDHVPNFLAKSGLMALWPYRFFTTAVLHCMQNHGLCCTSHSRKATYRLDIISACGNGLVRAWARSGYTVSLSIELH